jgi:hypothetical protein
VRFCGGADGDGMEQLTGAASMVMRKGGLLDISTARYFYKVSKTILHKPTAISGINIFYNKCSYKHYLHLL